MRYFSLTDSEVLTLQEGQRNHPNAVFRQRCSCLLLSHQSCLITPLAKLYQTHTIRTWFDRYDQMGIVGLRVLPGRGRQPLLQATHQPMVEAVLATNRQSLKQVSQQVGQPVSKGQLKAFLKSSAGAGSASAKVSNTNKMPSNIPSKKLN